MLCPKLCCVGDISSAGFGSGDRSGQHNHSADYDETQLSPMRPPFCLVGRFFVVQEPRPWQYGSYLGTQVWRSELHPFHQDVKFALRQLRRSPGFTLAITTTLAISLGAVIGIFVVVDGIVLRPLPYPQPDRLMEVSTRYDSGPEYHVIRSAQFRFLQQFSQVFDSLALYEVAPSGVNLSGSGDPESVPATYVTADFFRVLGITPTLGRAFS